MICPRCAAPQAADATFCDECGAPLEAACPHCGTTNRPGAKFCKKCRHPLGDPSPRPALTAKARTPPHLVERILSSKAAIEGERKQVTVLCADLKGSTTRPSLRKAERGYTQRNRAPWSEEEVAR